MSEIQPTSIYEYADQLNQHKQAWARSVDEKFPTELADVIRQSQLQLRATLHATPDDLVVVFGEQTYGLNERPKVLGKRLIAKALQRLGIKPIELFAAYDVVGSEPAIYRYQIPDPSNPEGVSSINTLPGWKKRKNSATAGFPCPTPEQISTFVKPLEAGYRPSKTHHLEQMLLHYHGSAPNYAEGNSLILRSLERQIGLDIPETVYEQDFDTLIATHGGMQLLLYLWPEIIQQAQAHQHPGVSVPQPDATPFQMYHTDPYCMGRMESSFSKPTNPNMESAVSCRCMECGYQTSTSPQQIIETQVPITWRAIPRVIAYSTLGLFDGHITGGGSVYEKTVIDVTRAMGLPYFPLIHMDRTIPSGEKKPIFDYSSDAASKKGPNVERATKLVKENGVSTIDLVLSIGVSALNHVITETVSQNLTTTTTVICPPPCGKFEKVIAI